MGIISKVRHLLPLDHLRSLYLMLVEPYYGYCCLIWAGAYKSNDLDKLLKIQKKILPVADVSTLPSSF